MPQIPLSANIGNFAFCQYTFSVSTVTLLYCPLNNKKFKQNILIHV